MSRGGTSLEGVVNAEIVVLEEELAGKSAGEFQNRVREAIENGKNQFILDCKALKTVNSEGLEALLWMIEAVQESGGLVKIATLGKIPRQVFALTQFDRIFEIYDDVIAALKSF